MGEIAHVDLDRLRAVADGFSSAAADVAATQWPTLDRDALPNSVVGALHVRDMITGQLVDLIADLNGWATAAHESAEAFRQADTDNGRRFGPR